MTETLISFTEAGRMLGLDHTTLHKKPCGTEALTRVRLGRRVVLVRSEVEQLIKRKIAEAREGEAARQRAARERTRRVAATARRSPLRR